MTNQISVLRKSINVFAIAALLVSGFFVANSARAMGLAPAPSPCAVVGTPFLTITRNISNDPDSGKHGNWATDAFKENITVWVGTDRSTYCANANATSATFVTTGPLSPENGSPLASGIAGAFTGGENYTLSSLVLNPLYSTSSPQTITLPDSSTEGFSAWVHYIFPSVDVSLGSSYVNTYSLTYVTPHNGTWTDADLVSGGDVGDIGSIIDTKTGITYSTIQAAISADATMAGDTINVAAGTYNEHQIVINKPLTLQGAGVGQSIIDGGDAPTTSMGLVRIVANGDVTFSGFTLQRAGGPTFTTNKDGLGEGRDGGDNLINVGIVTSGPSGATYTISNNKIVGTNNSNDQEDYGFYANSESGGLESDVFTHNQITGTGANSILIEKHAGPTEVSHNILDEGVYGTVTYFNMTYGGLNISSLQKVSDNTINLGTGTGDLVHDNYTGGGIVFRSSFAGGGGDGEFSNIQITGNTITNMKVHRRGIALSNDAATPSAGEISNYAITGNTITGTGQADSIGIKITGLVSNGGIMGNGLTNVGKGLVWDGASLLNATNNWWGSANPVFATILSGNVNHDPWFVNPERTILSNAVTGGNTITGTNSDVSLGSGGHADLPTGITDLVLSNNSDLDLSGGLSGGAVTLNSGTPGDPVVLTNSDQSNVSVSIPDGTAIHALGWDGILNTPQANTNVAPGTIPAGFGLSLAIDMGSNSQILTFDHPVTIIFDGVFTNLIYREPGADWVQITNVCVAPYATPTIVGNECYITNATNTKILTNHFTTFGALGQIHSTSGGGGGGGFFTPTPVSTPASNPVAIAPTVPTTPVGQVLGAITYSNGTLVKTADSATVYMVVDGKLRPFNAAAIFKARGLKFSDIQTITSDLVTTGNLGRVVGYSDGTLIKGSAATVYRVLGDTKQGITSMDAFNKMNLSLKNIVKVSDTDLGNYDDGGIAQ